LPIVGRIFEGRESREDRRPMKWLIEKKFFDNFHSRSESPRTVFGQIIKEGNLALIALVKEG